MNKFTSPHTGQVSYYSDCQRFSSTNHYHVEEFEKDPEAIVAACAEKRSNRYVWEGRGWFTTTPHPLPSYTSGIDITTANGRVSRVAID